MAVWPTLTRIFQTTKQLWRVYSYGFSTRRNSIQIHRKKAALSSSVGEIIGQEVSTLSQTKVSRISRNSSKWLCIAKFSPAMGSGCHKTTVCTVPPVLDPYLRRYEIWSKMAIFGLRDFLSWIVSHASLDEKWLLQTSPTCRLLHIRVDRTAISTMQWPFFQKYRWMLAKWQCHMYILEFLAPSQRPAERIWMFLRHMEGSCSSFILHYFPFPSPFPLAKKMTDLFFVMLWFFLSFSWQKNQEFFSYLLIA